MIFGIYFENRCNSYQQFEDLMLAWMKILHLSSFDYGGAGIAAYRLHKHFLTLGLDSRMLVLDSRSKDQSVTEAPSNLFQKQVVRNFQKYLAEN